VNFLGWLFNDAVSIEIFRVEDKVSNKPEAVGGIKIGKGNKNTLRNPPTATLSTIAPTLCDLGSNPGHRDGNQET
jgi:hypothetical protein